MATQVLPTTVVSHLAVHCRQMVEATLIYCQEALMLNKPCLSCNVAMAKPGQSRCFSCAAVKDHERQAHRRAAVSTNAARRMRRAVNNAGSARCAYCRSICAASFIQVDHRIALVDGGTDTESNVQPVCKDCHVDKTTAENNARRAR
jgi:5-methylcytosine-specific restriction endonuclease McrA